MQQAMQIQTHKITTNRIKLVGTVKEIVESFESMNIKYNKMILSVTRLSGTVDEIPVVYKASGAWMAPVGAKVEVEGTVRTRNVEVNGKNKLEISVYGFISIPEKPEGEEEVKDVNEVELEGFICKQPVLRETPFKKQISDILIAVNTSYSRSHYIPLVAFYSEARKASKMQVGDKIVDKGRFQSRTYTKKISETESEERTAYEVVLSDLNKVEDEVKSTETTSEGENK